MIFILIFLAMFMINGFNKSSEFKVNISNKGASIIEGNKKVTGIGGIFFKCKSPQKMRDWYSKNLGLVTNEYGSMFEFRKSDPPNEKAYLQWSPFNENTDYFEPSDKQFMINYRVENIEALVEELRSAGVNVLDSISSYDYGKFVHILDPENNKIELWEPAPVTDSNQFPGETTK
jgi:predicted enzyme related to lactoylglutathione lyase